MSHPSKVVITGPLAIWREQLTTEFVRLGYALSTVARQLQLLAHLSRWMTERGVESLTYLANRAGIVGRVGSHRLRHSAATAVLAGGETLEEAGQLLRHRSVQATMIYARTDLGTLAQLARPWPGSLRVHV